MPMMRIIGLANGAKHPYAGQYLKAYDPDDGVHGRIEVTRDPTKALELPRSELIALWRQSSKTIPLRPDGQPNRPLTAFSVEIRPTHYIRNPTPRRPKEPKK